MKCWSLLFLAGLLVACGSLQQAEAAGATAHATAAERVIDRLSSSELKQMIRDYPDDFYNGVTWPDALQAKLKKDKKSDDDQLSHGRKTKKSKIEGWTAHYLDYYREGCGSPRASSGNEHCARTLSFYMGSLAHLVVDGPWHKQFIDHTTADECSGKLSDSDGTDFRHAIADYNVDLCLERRYRGLKSDIQSTAHLPAEKGEKAGKCKSGEISDPRKGGECWKCPKGYIRSLESITTWKTRNKSGSSAKANPNGCIKVFAKNKKASYKRKIGCGSGWTNVGGRCWRCPSGFTRTLEAVSSSRACQKATRLPCSKQQVAKGSSRPRLGASVSPFVYMALAEAYKRDGKDYIDKEYAKDALHDFRVDYGREGLAAGITGVKAYGGGCDWIYSHAFSGEGGLDDGRDETVRLIDAVWEKLYLQKPVHVIRTDTYKYMAVLLGEEIYETEDQP